MKKEKNWPALMLFSISAALKVTLLIMLYATHHEPGSSDHGTHNNTHISSLH